LGATHRVPPARMRFPYTTLFRSGLDHTLADTKVKGGKGKPDRDPTDEERKARRVLLALSWLSVESKLGAPAGFIIASGTEAAERSEGHTSELQSREKLVCGLRLA